MVIRKQPWPIRNDLPEVTPPDHPERRGAALPSSVEIYARTPDFTHLDMPAALTVEHAYAEGVWAVLRVLEGAVLFSAANAPVVQTIPAGCFLTIEPELAHRLLVAGHARFFIEFHIPKDKIRATIPSGSC